MRRAEVVGRDQHVRRDCIELFGKWRCGSCSRGVHGRDQLGARGVEASWKRTRGQLLGGDTAPVEGGDSGPWWKSCYCCPDIVVVGIGLEKRQVMDSSATTEQ